MQSLKVQLILSNIDSRWKEFFSHQRKSHNLDAVTSGSFSPCQSPPIYFLSLWLAILGIWYEWNHKHLAFNVWFISVSNLFVRFMSVVYTIHTPLLFMTSQYFIIYICHLSVDGYVFFVFCWFWMVPVYSFFVSVFLWTLGFILLSLSPREELLVQTAILF